jgi:hypothetical protein
VTLATAVSDRTPSALLLDPTKDPDGTTVTQVGYGVSRVVSGSPDLNSSGREFSVQKTTGDCGALIGQTGPFLCFSQTDGKGACSGDSGGPSFVSVGGTPKLAGIHFMGDQNCSQYGLDVRVDAVLDFLGKYVPAVCGADSFCVPACGTGGLAADPDCGTPDAGTTRDAGGADGGGKPDAGAKSDAGTKADGGATTDAAANSTGGGAGSGGAAVGSGGAGNAGGSGSGGTTARATGGSSGTSTGTAGSTAPDGGAAQTAAAPSDSGCGCRIGARSVSSEREDTNPHGSPLWTLALGLLISRRASRAPGGASG